ncbi:hypothetical protein VMCG_05247 [Cytospora schulzeri]|uniref:Atos-like C-terminal domain-containing protein n=1 Tax=Cytospora schulzeri TaxID=448051 RepID=A0A423WQV6_9PEZI|nr:hypothetical protein VMCG_05247 [Valsa malicola]
MPIFQEPFDQDDARVSSSAEAEAEPEVTPEPLPIHGQRDPSSQRNTGSLRRKVSEESIRTELCDGPIPDSPPNPMFPRSESASNTTSDRTELIEKLKRGESPTWSPKRHLESIFRRNGSREQSTSPRPKSSDSPALPSVSQAKATSDGNGQEAENAERMREGLAIERPSYASTSHGRSKSDDGPSPYVGQIDLENGLPNPTEASAARRKSRQRTNSETKRPQRDMDNDVEMADLDPSGETPDLNVRKATKQKRRSHSPKAPPGGSYRIPEKGQIQIIIKNQNKTAVKLFLVPYDLAGMEPGTKTFIRQRSYTAGGPIIENVPDTGNDKPALRYLAHLHVCCPARGRYYLYKSIRVVFANRVPDGKEKLRNEVTLPEPRFTPYKPIRVMHHFATQQTSGPGASLAAEKAFRRRSSGFSFGQQLPPFDPNEPMPSLPQLRARASSVQDRGMSLGRPMGSGMAGRQVLVAPTPVHAAHAAAGGAVVPPLSFAKGEIGGYVRNGGGNAGAGGSAAAEGLLSLRLRSLGMQNVYQQETDGKEENKEM